MDSKRIELVQSDGGRKEAGYAERNDCTVRALAHATGMPYTFAHHILQNAGRPPKKGPSWPKWESVVKAHGFAIFLPRTGLTVGQFIEEHKKGTFIIAVRAHTFAIKDGKAYDTQAVGKRKPVRWYAYNLNQEV